MPSKPTAVRRLASTRAENIERCKTFGHSWFEVDADRRPIFGYYLVLECERCATKRYDTINHWGVVAGRRYVYEDGYRDTQSGKYDRSRGRLFFLRRIASTEIQKALRDDELHDPIKPDT